jgi:RNA recognition motif-containing protein
MSPEDAKKALNLNGTEFLGRKIVVSIANSKQRSFPKRHSGGLQGRFRRRRSGPRVYGQKDNTPIERLE